MEAVKLHHIIATGGSVPDENFGIEPLSKAGGPSPDKGQRAVLKEGSRGISRPRGFHPEPDHGEP